MSQQKYFKDPIKKEGNDSFICEQFTPTLDELTCSSTAHPQEGNKHRQAPSCSQSRQLLWVKNIFTL